MDTISTSQALQIAGRAGRFSSMFKEGEVTTMHRDDLPVLKEILSRPVDPVEVRDTYETSSPPPHLGVPMSQGPLTPQQL